jgi:thiol-disulfide isomerase/thioredoxin
MRRLVAISASVLMVGLQCISGQSRVQGQDEKKIEMPPIKLKAFLAHVADHKGKVVVVDLWGACCPPCMEEFPNLVRMHETYGGKGLVCLSLSLDFNDPLRKQALKFLQEKKAVFKNYWLEESFKGAQKEWDFTGIPAIVVFGKDGKVAKVFKNEDVDKDRFTYKKDVEPFVKELLEAK